MSFIKVGSPQPINSALSGRKCAKCKGTYAAWLQSCPHCAEKKKARQEKKQ